MSKFKEHYRETRYRPQAAKSLRRTLYSFIRREFPRLGGSWVVWTFVDDLLEIVDSYRFFHGKLKPGQVVWPAVAVDERPVYRKPMRRTRQVPVIVTIVDQDDVADLCSNAERYQVLEQAIVRAAFDAYAQDGVSTWVSCSTAAIPALLPSSGNTKKRRARLSLGGATSTTWVAPSLTNASSAARPISKANRRPSLLARPATRRRRWITTSWTLPASTLLPFSAG